MTAYVVAEWPPTGQRFQARIDPEYGVVVIVQPEKPIAANKIEAESR